MPQFKKIQELTNTTTPKKVVALDIDNNLKLADYPEIEVDSKDYVFEVNVTDDYAIIAEAGEFNTPFELAVTAYQNGGNVFCKATQSNGRSRIVLLTFTTITKGELKGFTFDFLDIGRRIAITKLTAMVQPIATNLTYNGSIIKIDDANHYYTSNPKTINNIADEIGAKIVTHETNITNNENKIAKLEEKIDQILLHVPVKSAIDMSGTHPYDLISTDKFIYDSDTEITKISDFLNIIDVEKLDVTDIFVMFGYLAKNLNIQFDDSNGNTIGISNIAKILVDNNDESNLKFSFYFSSPNPISELVYISLINDLAENE